MEVISGESTPYVTPGALFDTWVSCNKNEKKSLVSEKMLSILKLSNPPEGLQRETDKLAEFYCLKFRTKWIKCARNRTVFLSKYKNWLNTKMSLPETITAYLSETRLSQPGTSRGRPLKAFGELSDRGKKRRVAELVATTGPQELQYAAEMSAKLSNYSSTSKNFLSLEQTLALYLDLNLSEHKYCILRSVVNGLHKECFPSLNKLRQFKKDLLPQNISTTDSVVEVNLQELLNNTVSRLLMSVRKKIMGHRSLTLICKWGFDGSSGHSMYKQRFDDSTTSDFSLFVTAFVPLQLIERVSNNVFWSNPRPSSTFFCRPIRLAFIKESKNVVQNEEARMNSCIENLTEYEVAQEENILKTNYKMLFTMLDGSAINTVSATNATSNCFICGAKPSEMNLDSVAKKPPNLENYKYGLSSLHCWIRCFECCLHIAYRLPFKSWQARGPEKKTMLEERKRHIQGELRAKMGLVVDVVKQGYGTTNDGNTARKFFSNPKLSAEITGMEEEFIYSLGLILRILSSGRSIILDKFDFLINKTKELYLNHYSWYFMPNSLHKLLIHGKDIISSFELPIGVLSEEALEATHKEIRKNRLDHTRKSSRIKTNTDLINRLLLTSDPHISSLRKIKTKKFKDFDDEISCYLVNETSLESESFNLPSFDDLGDFENISSNESENE